jgi:hypothetical protein
MEPIAFTLDLKRHPSCARPTVSGVGRASDLAQLPNRRMSKIL